MKGNGRFAVRLAAVGAAVLLGLAPDAEAKVEVMCVYYPHWHRYLKGDEWFGTNRWAEGEWEFVKPGELAPDPTHASTFCQKFEEIARGKGVFCRRGTLDDALEAAARLR